MIQPPKALATPNVKQDVLVGLANFNFVLTELVLDPNLASAGVRVLKPMKSRDEERAHAGNGDREALFR